MIRAMLIDAQKSVATELETSQIAGQIKKRRRPFLWVDILEEPPDKSEEILTQAFGFHPLAVEDALHEVHTPKVNDWEDYLYLVIRAIDLVEDRQEPLETNEVDIFLGKNYLVTYQSKSIPAIDQAWEKVLAKPRLGPRIGSTLLYRIADEIVDEYLTAIDALDVRIEELEDRIFDDPRQDVVEEIFTLKRSLLHLRRILAPQREVFNKLARGDFDLIPNQDRILFRDIYDHLVRLHDIIESLRDLVGGSLETYLSIVSNRMNEVMKTLTIFTALFMPLTFLTGFFGMNYFQPAISLAAWTGAEAFTVMLLLIITTPIVMYFWMRRRLWL